MQIRDSFTGPHWRGGIKTVFANERVALTRDVTWNEVLSIVRDLPSDKPEVRMGSLGCFSNDVCKVVMEIFANRLQRVLHKIISRFC